MKQHIKSFCFLIAAGLLIGCASTKKVSWNDRIGNYTYDQAVIELGPPDKMAMLSDQSKVAEWYTRGNSGAAVGIGTGVGTGFGSRSYGGAGVGVGFPIASSSVRTRRLVFGPDGILKSFKN